jgi:hypothetical protein
MSKQPKHFYRDGSPGEVMELREPNETTSLSTLNAGYLPQEGLLFGSPKRMGGRYSRVAWNSSMHTIPMFLFVAILLGFVFHYQVETKDASFPNLRLPDQQNESNVYYVKISSTILVLLRLGPVLWRRHWRVLRWLWSRIILQGSI